MKPWIRWSKIHEKLLGLSQNVLVYFQYFYLRLDFPWVAIRMPYIPFHGFKSSFCILVFYRLTWKIFQCMWPDPVIFLLVSVFFQTELLQCPTHRALLKDTLLNFSYGRMQIFMCLAWFLIRNILHEFSIFHNGVPIDLYTSVWFVLAVLETFLSIHIFPIANVTSNTVSFSFFSECFSSLCLLWCVYFLICLYSLLAKYDLWKKIMTTGACFINLIQLK